MSKKREVVSGKCATCRHSWEWHSIRSLSYECLGHDCECKEFELDYGDVVVQT